MVQSDYQHGATLTLVSVKDSKITAVSVYSNCAQITRVFKFAVKTGQNQLNIIGLPGVLDQESLTSVSTNQRVNSLKILELMHQRAQKELQRNHKLLRALEIYLRPVNVEHLEIAGFDTLRGTYDKDAEMLDNKVLELELELKDISNNIAAEKNALATHFETTN